MTVSKTRDQIHEFAKELVEVTSGDKLDAQFILERASVLRGYGFMLLEFERLAGKRGKVHIHL